LWYAVRHYAQIKEIQSHSYISAVSIHIWMTNPKTSYMKFPFNTKIITWETRLGVGPLAVAVPSYYSLQLNSTRCMRQTKRTAVTPDFPKKTKCISYVRQDQVYTHMIDVMSEISINSNKNV
jgi:hypothetical protein